jgi:uncharacterized protein (TIGR03435 family)
MLKAAAVLVVALALALAGAAQELAFEVASVKRNVSGQGLPFPRFQPGGRFLAPRMTLQDLMRAAFASEGIQMASQIEGGPDWIGSDRFDIIATVSEDLARRDDLASLQGALLQNLLAERFKLKVHTESRERPIYELVVVGKDGALGPQLTRSTCIRPTAAPTSAAPGTQPCTLRIGGPANITAEGVTMPELATALSNFPIVDRVVRDRTNLTGAFDFQIRFVGAFTIGPGGTVGPPNPNADSGPSLFTALQEQLGLKLEPGRGPVTVIVVDHAEPPTED